MEQQFDNLLEPDPSVDYYCGPRWFCSGFTHLMKLCLMVKNNDEAFLLIKKIIAENPEEINKKNSLNVTALMLACINCAVYSSIECVKFLIESGANLDEESISGSTALRYACVYVNVASSIECVKLLIESGANVYKCDITGVNVLECICREYNFTIDDVDFLMDLIYRSRATLQHKNFDGKTPYYYYRAREINILNNDQIMFLRGKKQWCFVKSANSISNSNRN